MIYRRRRGTWARVDIRGRTGDPLRLRFVGAGVSLCIGGRYMWGMGREMVSECCSLWKS